MKLLWVVAAFVGLVIVGVACVQSFGGPLNVDFTMFWRADELAYPPPYLLLVRCLGWLPYGAAFVLWVGLTGALYLATAPAPKTVALANPAAVFNGMIGQNGFLTAGIMFAGLRELSRDPVRAGAILGLLVIKPHLAVMLPVAVIAGRLWRAIPSAAAVAAVLCGISLVVLGPEAWQRFFAMGATYGGLLGQKAWNWNEIASFYALARWLGVSEIAAWGVHVAVAFGAGAAVWMAWRDDADGKIALAAAASLLVSPYLFTYDAVLLTAALAWMRGPKAALLWVLIAVPLVRVFFDGDWPNTVPLAAAFSVLAIAAEARRGERVRPIAEQPA
ncbi:DUF2029 domain-containing protein [Sphingomonas sp. SM33]|uniref:DUF2029 domain-containing protein n=1 Tax=Sphingomonas telluris TaxID=2907998 RepID=A0ABS9VJ99_9SPHN|nr:DUF2029 domain-containing protein [Sphingomonas telluris]